MLGALLLESVIVHLCAVYLQIFLENHLSKES